MHIFEDPPSGKEDTPLYNSRVIKLFVDYTRARYDEVDLDLVLQHAGITTYELGDQGHWFTQREVDGFYEALVGETKNPDIAREVGREAATSEQMRAIRRYSLGFISLTSIYLLLAKIYPTLSRGARIDARKLGLNRVEIISTPLEGVQEKPYQCENRLGMFESVARLFTEKIAQVEHPECFHRGDPQCRYIISWDRTPSVFWKSLRNFAYPAALLAAVVLFIYFPSRLCLELTLGLALVLLLIALKSEKLGNRELTKNIERLADSAKDHLAEINIRYNNAMLVQEIGQATSTILNIEALIEAVVKIMHKRLDFDRGMIMLANRRETRLVYAAGYGYNGEDEALLRKTQFHLDNPESRGIFVVTFREQKPFLLNDMGEIEKNLSKRSLALAKRLGVRSLVCVPIVYENNPLGILAVDNKRSKRPLTRSDMGLLTGVASQTALSIVNARSFEKLRESERKYRELVEGANSIILRLDTKGAITFFNEFAQRFFGFREDEILGRNILGTLLPETESARQGFKNLLEQVQHKTNGQGAVEQENILQDGSRVWIAWTYKAVFEDRDTLKEILCIGQDITGLKHAQEEKKVLETQLQRAQKLEAIGTLAGGIAHDFNNILQAIFGYTQVLMMGKDREDPEYAKLEAVEKSVQMATELTQRLLIFGRKVESHLRPVNLNQEVIQVAKVLERTIPKMISIELRLYEGINIIDADAGQVEQILMNLGVNARDAMPDGGRLVFETQNITLDRGACQGHLRSALPGNYVLLTVSDTGQGIENDVLEHIFEPFFTTKDVGKGTGLGLAVVYGIVESHGGYVVCETSPGQGTAFKVYFPVSEHVPEASREKEAEAPMQGGNEWILLVDDEERIRELGREILTKFGYTVLIAPNGESALELYQEEPTKVALVVLDLIMPGMGGLRCLEGILRLNPRAKVLIASGYSVDGSAKEAVKAGAKGFIAKPYAVRKMLKTIREVLDSG